MQKPLRSVTALLLLSPVLYAQHVRDPHASLADIPAQQKLFASGGGKQAAPQKVGSCLTMDAVPAPPTPMSIPHHYMTGSNGPVNPAEAEATRLYGAFEHRVTAGMNRYIATGSHAEAACALAQLDTWAQANALTAYDPFANKSENSQSWYQAEWTLSSTGIAMSVLVNDPQLDPAQSKRVITWLDRAIHKVIDFERPGKDNNNHHYWRASAAAAIGVTANDDKLFRFAADTYKEAIADIDARGALPKEMARHENAIHYQCFALQPLIVVAEFAARQGVDLYGFSANGHTIRDAILFFGRAATDPSLVKPYTEDEQKLKFGAGDFAPFALFVAHAGPTGLPANIADSIKTPASTTRTGGNMLLFVAR